MPEPRAGKTECQWCGELIADDDETAEGPTSRIGMTVTMHAECAIEANDA